MARLGGSRCSPTLHTTVILVMTVFFLRSFRGAPSWGANLESRTARGAGFRVCAQGGASRNDANIHTLFRMTAAYVGYSTVVGTAQQRLCPPYEFGVMISACWG